MISDRFQRVNAFNTASLQEATDRITQANATYSEIASALRKRSYATFLVVNTIENLVDVTGDKTPLKEIDLNVSKRRYDDYYEQVTFWALNYPRWLGDIELAFDRPLGRRNILITNAKLRTLDCRAEFSEQFKRLDLDWKNLKLWLIAINFCRVRIGEKIGALKQGTTGDEKNDAFMSIEDFQETSNRFLCRMANMIDYYRDSKRTQFNINESLFSLTSTQSRLRPESYFDRTDIRCS